MANDKIDTFNGNNNEESIELDEDGEDRLPEKYSISSYGADYVVDMLVKRLKSNDILIPPFQREFIWNIKQSSRFIESLLLGLPVPGIFLSKDEDTKKLLVIDGQQRLRTLQYFYEGIFAFTGKEFSLINVQKNLKGKTYKSLEEVEKRQLDDSIIHATIIKQDKPSNDNTSVYHIFERLNTSGTPLTHQEIRATIYLGEFNNLLENLNKNDNWRNLYGKISNRRRDQEFILRFFALFYNRKAYAPPMRLFLNDFMQKNRHLKLIDADKLTQLFTKTVKAINQYIDKKAFRPVSSFNAAVFDAVIVGIGERISKGNITNGEYLKENFEKLLVLPEFIDAIETGTTAKASSIVKRINLAISIFKDIK